MKKECEFFDDKLLEYALGELDTEPELKKKIGEHIGICTDCWKKVDEYRQASAMAASVMKVDFSDDVWAVQRKEIIRRVTYRVDVLEVIRKFLVKVMTTRKLAAGFAMLIMLAAGAGAGFKYHAYQENLKAERTMTSRIDMFENMEIIERLDFYKTMNDERIQL